MFFLFALSPHLLLLLFELTFQYLNVILVQTSKYNNLARDTHNILTGIRPRREQSSRLSTLTFTSIRMQLLWEQGARRDQ